MDVKERKDVFDQIEYYLIRLLLLALLLLSAYKLLEHEIYGASATSNDAPSVHAQLQPGSEPCPAEWALARNANSPVRARLKEVRLNNH
jgi:hypothetical protein